MVYEEGIKGILDFERTNCSVNYVELETLQTSQYYRNIYEILERHKNDNIRILSKGLIGTVAREEFLRGEEIIQGIVGEIKPEWSAKQKAAYVHYRIGDIVSYMPDCIFNNKVGNQKAKDARSIWKSVNSGISLCNGIAELNRNILSRVGIQTKGLSSRTHEFIMVETDEGNILMDPTWDLSNTLFEGRPMYFGKTYEQLCQMDGPFSKAHRLEETPENVIEISVDELREIYKSIDIAKDDGKFRFPILDKVNEINNQQFENKSDKVEAFFQMFTQNFSKQAIHLSETRTMIERCMPEVGIDNKTFTTSFVYSKDDETSENPYLCIHINNEEMKNNMVILNTEQMQFENISIQDFEGLYMQHREDTREPFWRKYLHMEEVSKEKEEDKLEK